MKFRKRPWTPEEDGLLREYADVNSHKGTHLKRTPLAIRARARDLGITGQKSLSGTSRSTFTTRNNVRENLEFRRRLICVRRLRGESFRTFIVYA